VCCEGCITEHKQVVPHSVCAEWSFGSGSTAQGIHRFITNIVSVKCDFKVVY